MYFSNTKNLVKSFFKSSEVFDLYRDKVRILSEEEGREYGGRSLTVNFDINNENDFFISGVTKKQHRNIKCLMSGDGYYALVVSVEIVPNKKLPYHIPVEYCRYLSDTNRSLFKNPHTCPLVNNPLVQNCNFSYYVTTYGYGPTDNPEIPDRIKSTIFLRYESNNKLFSIPTNDEEMDCIDGYCYFDEIRLFPKHIFEITDWLFMTYYDSMVDYLIKIGREDCIKYTQIPSLD